MREKSVAQSEERCFDPVTKPVPRDQALARSGVAPMFESAVGNGCSRRAETCGMEELPDEGKVGEVLAFEDLAEVDLDEGRPGEAGVVAHQSEAVAVGAKAPQRMVGVLSQSCRAEAAERLRPSPCR